VDDDESLRESLEGLLKAMGYTVSVFSSAEGFFGLTGSSQNQLPDSGRANAGNEWP
jgi:FixJ family two-component response regulator